jgi:hypothetical protein
MGEALAEGERGDVCLARGAGRRRDRLEVRERLGEQAARLRTMAVNLSARRPSDSDDDFSATHLDRGRLWRAVEVPRPRPPDVRP